MFLGQRDWRAWVTMIPVVAIALIPACRSSSRSDCTAELGVSIKPQDVGLVVGQRVYVAVETTTCGGAIRKVPRDLEWRAGDVAVASVDRGEIVGVGPGRTRVVITSSEFGELGMVEVLVVDR